MTRSDPQNLKVAEFNLLAACLLRALQDLVSPLPEVAAEARMWFHEPPDNYIFSFHGICDALGLEPKWVRDRAESIVKGSAKPRVKNGCLGYKPSRIPSKDLKLCING